MSKRAYFYFWLANIITVLILAGCAAPPPDTTPTRQAVTKTATDIPTATNTPTITPTSTATPTPSSTPGPGLDELMGTPNALMQNARLDEALEAYDQLADLYPDKADPRLKQAAVALQQGDNERAIEYLQMAIESEPDNLNAWRQYALVLDSVQDYDNLIDVYSAMLALTPDDADLLIARAMTYARLQDTQAAIDDLSAAQTIAPTREYAWLQVAAAANSSRAYDIAFEISSAGLEHNPEMAGLWLEQGLALLSMNDPQTAIESFDHVIELDERNYTAYRWRGWTLADSGKNEAGLADLQMAIDLGLQAGIIGINEAYDAMADAADVIARDDPQAAFQFMAQYVFTHGSRDPLIVGYARIDWRRGNIELAITRLNPLVEDGYVPAMFWRGLILVDDGQTEAAVDDLSAFVEVRRYGPQAEQARRILESLKGE